MKPTTRTKQYECARPTVGGHVCSIAKVLYGSPVCCKGLPADYASTKAPNRRDGRALARATAWRYSVRGSVGFQETVRRLKLTLPKKIPKTVTNLTVIDQKLFHSDFIINFEFRRKILKKYLIPLVSLCLSAPLFADHSEHWNFMTRFDNPVQNSSDPAHTKLRQRNMEVITQLNEMRCHPISVGAGVGMGIGGPNPKASSQERILFGAPGTYGSLNSFPPHSGYAEVTYVVYSCPAEMRGRIKLDENMQVQF